MQQVVITLNVLLISRTKNAYSDNALLVVFWNLKAGFKGGMHVGGWAEEKCTCLYIHMRYSQVFVASLNLTVIRIAKLQAGK